jgi:hypothetical protein
MDKKSSAQSPKIESAAKEPITDLTAKEIEDILVGAHQTVKPIITREAADEIVSDDLLNFRMKAAR